MDNFEVLEGNGGKNELYNLYNCTLNYRINFYNNSLYFQKVNNQSSSH